jgi:hypothetical protein
MIRRGFFQTLAAVVTAIFVGRPPKPVLKVNANMRCYRMGAPDPYAYSNYKRMGLPNGPIQNYNRKKQGLLLTYSNVYTPSDVSIYTPWLGSKSICVHDGMHQSRAGCLPS